MTINFFSQKKYKGGDIVFVKNNSWHFNYIGILLIENGLPVIYHSDGVVTKTNLNDFIKGKKYSIKRITEEDFITEDVIIKMHSLAQVNLGLSYNNVSFVWDIYRQITGLPLCRRDSKSVRNINRNYFLE